MEQELQGKWGEKKKKYETAIYENLSKLLGTELKRSKGAIFGKGKKELPLLLMRKRGYWIIAHLIPQGEDFILEPRVEFIVRGNRVIPLNITSEAGWYVEVGEVKNGRYSLNMTKYFPLLELVYEWSLLLLKKFSQSDIAVKG